MPNAAPRYKYLDGLRGISIIPVLLGHTYDAALFPPVLRMLFAGDAGVRVFFVVSGYIITQLLLAERRASQRVRLAAFYGRRAAKLLPVLWLYVLGVVIAQRFVDLHCSAFQLVAAALLASGLIAEGTWYVGHFWSLTVEEVFYVSWAPVMAFTSRRTALRVALAILLTATACRVLDVAASSHHFAQLFAFWPRLRVVPELDGVAIGCITALLRERLTAALPTRSLGLSRATWIVAWLVVCAGAIQLEHSIGVPALSWAISLARRPLMEVAVAVVILLAAERQRSGGSSWLESKPLVALGRASYSIYVVQQAFCVPAAWRPATLLARPPLNVAVAIAVGCALFVLLEDPLRRAIVRRWGLARG
jgi:peptidoglycan/LPS O-acetylase OafA/YrhL